MSDLNEPWQMPLDEAMQKAATYSERHKDVPSVSRTLRAEIERLEARLAEARDLLAGYQTAVKLANAMGCDLVVKEDKS